MDREEEEEGEGCAGFPGAGGRSEIGIEKASKARERGFLGGPGDPGSQRGKWAFRFDFSASLQPMPAAGQMQEKYFDRNSLTPAPVV